jgi:hypothetical protein
LVSAIAAAPVVETSVRNGASGAVKYMAGVVEAVIAVATRFAPRTARTAGLRWHDRLHGPVTMDRGACDCSLPDPSRR